MAFPSVSAPLFFMMLCPFTLLLLSSSVSSFTYTCQVTYSAIQLDFYHVHRTLPIRLNCTYIPKSQSWLVSIIFCFSLETTKHGQRQLISLLISLHHLFHKLIAHKILFVSLLLFDRMV